MIKRFESVSSSNMHSFVPCQLHSVKCVHLADCKAADVNSKSLHAPFCSAERAATWQQDESHSRPTDLPTAPQHRPPAFSLRRCRSQRRAANRARPASRTEKEPDSGRHQQAVERGEPGRCERQPARSAAACSALRSNIPAPSTSRSQLCRPDARVQNVAEGRSLQG